MKEIMLDCFKEFECIADKCKDNCCIGWEIDIDADTLGYYDSLTVPMKIQIDAGVSRDGTPHFILGENERCPFLNKSNLCDIIINLGKEHIPYICKNHPRFYTWLPDRTESGVGICCEVATKLLLSSRDKLNTNIPYTLSENLSDVMTYAREVAFSILQNRNLSLCDRLCIFTDFCYGLDEHLIFEDIAALKRTADLYKNRTTYDSCEPCDISDILKLYSGLEPIDVNWSTLISGLSDNRDRLLAYFKDFQKTNQDNFYKYEHLAVYFTYRHFLNCTEDFNIASTGNLIVLSVIFCAICDAYSLLLKGIADTECNAKLYSKQVEYSMENTDTLRNSDIENIKGLLPIVFGR